jgi:hypothetical protein
MRTAVLMLGSLALYAVFAILVARFLSMSSPAPRTRAPTRRTGGTTIGAILAGLVFASPMPSPTLSGVRSTTTFDGCNYHTCTEDGFCVSTALYCQSKRWHPPKLDDKMQPPPLFPDPQPQEKP